MAKEEEKDGLFSINLGEDLIEVDIEEKVDDNKTKKEDDKEINKDTDDSKLGKPLIYDDGDFEIDEHLQKTIDNAANADIKDGDDKTIIEKTDKQTEGKGIAPSDSDSSSDSSPSSSPYLAFAKDRAKEGVFLDFSDEDWTGLVKKHEGDEAAALRDLSNVSMSETIKEGIQRYIDSITPEEKALYEAKEKGIPLDAYGIAKSNFTKYSNIKLDDIKEDIKLQEELASKVLELRSFSSEEIKEEIEGYKALENLESKAEKALEILPKIYEKRVKNLETTAEVEDQSRKDKIRQRVAKMKKMVDTTPEIIPGIKLTKPAREKILTSMTNPVARDAEGKPMNPVMATRAKNPEAFEMIIHYYHDLGLFNIDDDGNFKPDFSKIAKVEKTKATDDMRSAFESKEKPLGGKANVPRTDKDNNDDWDKAFSRL